MTHGCQNLSWFEYVCFKLFTRLHAFGIFVLGGFSVILYFIPT
jgi:hypothetical protein